LAEDNGEGNNERIFDLQICQHKIGLHGANALQILCLHSNVSLHTSDHPQVYLTHM